MATLGQVMVEVGADLSEFERAMADATAGIQTTSRQIQTTGENLSSGMAGSLNNIVHALENTGHGFDSLGRVTRRYNQIATTSMRNLPDHLKPFAERLRQTRREFQLTARVSTQSLDEMADSVMKTRVGMDKMTSVSSSGKKAIKYLQDMNDITKETRFAVLGFNKDATMRIDSRQATQQMSKFQSYVTDTRAKLEALRDAGDLGSYTAGMRVLTQQMNEVDQAMRSTATGGQAYVQQLQRLGVITEGVGNAMAVAMEGQRSSFFQAEAMLKARSTQSEKMIKNLGRMDIRGLDQQFLRLATHFEKLNKEGTATSVAIGELGDNASMKDLLDQVAMINQGIMRMQMLATGMGVAFAGLTVGIGAMAMGANVNEVKQQQAEITKAYHDALQQRADEIYNFTGLFDKVQLVKFDKKALTDNLSEQVDVLKGWSSNLDKLAKKGVSEGFLKELEKLGPQSAGQVKALASMTKPELDKYVALWKEKHKLARTQAMDELEQMKAETKKKIADLQATLKPLGVSIERAKGTWSDALQPFIDSWSYVSSKVVDAFNAVGNFVKKVNSLNPAISKTVGWIAYLATGLSAMLSPLAIGISRAGAMKVAFNALWMVIGPFVTGLLAVIGTALLWSTVITLVTQSMANMWKYSDGFRKAVVGVWDAIKSAFMTAYQTIKPNIQALSSTFSTLVSAFTGGGKSAGDVWKNIGDAVGKVITTITPLISTVFTAVFTTAFAIVGQAIDLLVMAFGYISDWWAKNGTQVIAVASKLFSQLQIAIQTVAGFIQAIMPVVMQVISVAFGIIKDVISAIFPVLLTLAQVLFPLIAKVVQFVFPIVLAIIQSVWNNIKNVIVSAVNIILDIVNIFKALFTGNWSLLWKSVVDLLKNALILVWNLVQLYFFKELFTGIKGFFMAVKGVFSGGWTWIANLCKTVIGGIKTNAVNEFKLLWTTLKSLWNGMKTGAVSIFGGLKTGLSVIFDSIKSIASSTWNGVKTLITSPIEKAKNIILGIIDTIKGAFSRLSIKIPKPTLPKITTGTKKFMGVAVPTFDVKWNAKGNMFKGPSVMGNQGFGEAGNEVAIPIERKRYMKPYASMVANLMGDMKNPSDATNSVLNQFNISSLVVREEADIKRIAEELDRIQRKQNRAKGVLA